MDKIKMKERMFGEYWFGYWLQGTLWILITQLLRNKFLQKSIIYRVLLSALFIVTFEKILIIMALYRDYIPSEWKNYLPNFGEAALGLFLAFISFIAITVFSHFILQLKKNE